MHERTKPTYEPTYLISDSWADHHGDIWTVVAMEWGDFSRGWHYTLMNCTTDQCKERTELEMRSWIQWSTHG